MLPSEFLCHGLPGTGCLPEIRRRGQRSCHSVTGAHAPTPVSQYLWNGEKDTAKAVLQ